MPVLIKSFGDNTLCHCVGEFINAINNKYLNKSVAIEVSLASGCKKLFYVDIREDGTVIDSYNNTIIQPILLFSYN